MAFIVSQKATYAWTVNVHYSPTGQARQVENQTFVGHFKKMPDAEFRERLAA